MILAKSGWLFVVTDLDKIAIMEAGCQEMASIAKYRRMQEQIAEIHCQIAAYRKSLR
jgi:hypothetical protein